MIAPISKKPHFRASYDQKLGFFELKRKEALK
jgi:hypothetical protein